MNYDIFMHCVVLNSDMYCSAFYEVVYCAMMVLYNTQTYKEHQKIIALWIQLYILI